MADLVISNFSHFKKHLEDGLHSVRPDENVEALLKNNAIFNKENLPWRWKTCFVKPTQGGYGYTPAWENDGELLRLIQDAVLLGHNTLQDMYTGRVEATYRFDRCIGVYSSFKNGIDATGGKYTKTLPKIWIEGIIRLRDIRGNVLPKFIELSMEKPCWSSSG